MSIPHNPMADFYTYSYYHVLIAGDSTATLRAADAQLNANPTAFLGHGLPRTREIQEIQSSESGEIGKYIVVIDGARDTDYVIQDLTFSSIVIPSGEAPHELLGVPQNGSMKVSELQGFSFIRLLTDLSTDFSRGNLDQPYLLKTYIIGTTNGSPSFSQDGSALTINVVPSDAPLQNKIIPLEALPVTFNAISVSIDQMGATYKCDFWLQVGGVGFLDPYNTTSARVRVGEPLDYFQRRERLNLLPNVLKSLVRQINIESNKTYEFNKTQVIEHNKKIQQHNSSATDDNKLIEIPLPVKKEFDIVVAPEYANYNVSTKPVATDDGLEDSYPNISFASNSNDVKIPDLIYQVLALSPQIDSDSRYMPRIIATSTKFKDGDILKDKVVYTIVKSDTFFDPSGTDLSLDYIFTGNNTDIIDFDMKVDNLSNVLYGVRNQVHSLLPPLEVTTLTKNEDNISFIPSAIPATDVQGGGSMPSPKEVSHSVLVSATPSKDVIPGSFENVLQQFVRLGTLNTKITILGNPLLLSKNLMTLTDVETTGEVKSTGGTKMVGQYFRVKINVKMPDKYDILGRVPTSFKPFWVQDVYALQQLDTAFINGTFTQTLYLINLSGANTI